MENKQPGIMIQSQYIKDLSMEIPHAPVIFKKLQKQNPKVGVEVNLDAQPLEEENFYNVLLTVRVNGDIEEDNQNDKAFILELTYGAVVALNVPQEHREPVLMIEIPHTIFPFARQIVANTMSEAGLPPLMLNPIDFVALFNAKHAPKQ
jgi:preprotein translocase subunit SecB